MTGWDMHEDPATLVPRDHQLPPGTTVEATVICHHPWGIGVKLADGTQYGHVNVPVISDGRIGGPEDYPPIGHSTAAMVLGYSGAGQLRLSTRQSDITKASPPGAANHPLATKAEELMAQLTLVHKGDIIYRGGEAFIAAEVVPTLLDQAQEQGLKVLGMEGFLVTSQHVYPALRRIADFSGDSVATSTIRARALLHGSWAEPPTEADQLHPSATGRHMITVLLGE